MSPDTKTSHPKPPEGNDLEKRITEAQKNRPEEDGVIKKGLHPSQGLDDPRRSNEKGIGAF